jgi:hypothetical protein
MSMGGGQYLLTGGWSFWPVGDFYQLFPKWDEWFSVTGNVIHSDDEKNRYELVAAYEGPDPYFVLQVTEDDPATTGIEIAVPTGTPQFSVRAWFTHGFGSEATPTVDLVVDDDDPELWTGKFKISFPSAFRQWAGVGRVVNFSFDFWPQESPYDRVRLAHGTVVFRR